MARLTVVVSQAQGRNPEKRKLEEDIITQLMLERGIDVLVVPHFYDLTNDSTAMLALRQINGHAVIASWLFPRAAHWLLDRNDIRGRMGSVLLGTEDEEEEEDESDEQREEAEDSSTQRVAESRPLPDRYLYHLDLRSAKQAQPFVDEVLRIQKESSVSVVSLGLGSSNGSAAGKSSGSPRGSSATPSNNGSEAPGSANGNAMIGLGSSGVVTESGSPQAPHASSPSIPTPANGTLANGVTPEAYERFQNPTNGTALPMGPISDLLSDSGAGQDLTEIANSNDDQVQVERLTDAKSKRRWYPVIDYSRCTNCMECIDFCLFGVYGVDTVDTILVDQPDNCRKGCPACSRVCPENAIMFPQHKTPAIAGSQDDTAGFKIDLSKLFGAPDEGKSAEEIAARERDEQLMLTGRQPLGMSGVRRRSKEAETRDELDVLIEELDQLDV